MAAEMSYANEYTFVDDETGERLGRRTDVVKALNVVRTRFGLRGHEEV